MAQFDLIKKEAFEAVVNALQTNDDLVQETITDSQEAVAQLEAAMATVASLTPVTFQRGFAGDDDLTVVPVTAGAVEDDISWFLDRGLFKLIRLESGSWEEFGEGIISRNGLNKVSVAWFDGATANERIQAAIDEAGAGGILTFPDGVYLMQDSVTYPKGMKFEIGNAIIKRANETVATLSVAADSTDNQIVVNSVPDNWKVGDEIHVYVGDSVEDTSQKRTITAIAGTTISLSGFLVAPTTALVGTTEFPIGSNVRKVFTLFKSENYPDPAHGVFYGGVFDGNRDNNEGNYYWNFNTCVNNFGFGGVFLGTRFINMPNENIVGSGTSVIGCTGAGLNGDFYHLSSHPDLENDIQGTTIFGNIVRGVCEVPLSKNNHNEAPVTHSWNPGKLTVFGNQFYGNGNNYAMELVRVDGEDNSNHNKVFYQNNYHENFSAIMPPPSTLFVADERVATGNTFNDCGVNDLTNLRVYHPGVVFENNYYYGDTEVLGFKITPRKETAMAALVLSELYKSRLSGESVTNYTNYKALLKLEDPLKKASFVLIPAAYKLNKLYPQLPADNAIHLPYTRSTAGNVQIYNGTAYENVAANIPLVDHTNGYPELLLEGDKANRFVNPTTPANQTITVTVGKDYTVTVWGSGTLTLSDSIVQVVSEGESYTFEATTTSLTCTVAGSLSFVQVEQGITATSRIVSASSTILTRLRSIVNFTDLISNGLTSGVAGLSNKYSLLMHFNPDYPGRTSAMTINLYNDADGKIFEIKPQSSSSLSLSVNEPGEGLIFNNISSNGKLLLVVDGTSLTIYKKTAVTNHVLTGANNFDRIEFSPVGDPDFAAQMRLRELDIFNYAIDRDYAETLVN